MVTISIVIPAACEGEDLYRRVYLFNEKLRNFAKEYNLTYEIIIATDIIHKETLKTLIKLSKDGVARCFLLTARVGKGGTIKNVIPLTKGDILVLLDADLPINPEFIIKATSLLIKENVALLVANRVYREHSLLRLLLSTAYNNIVNLIFRTNLKDHQAGFKILSKRAAEIILIDRTRSDGYTYDTEIIVWAKKHGLPYKVINVYWKEQRKEKQSTIPTLRAILTMMVDIILLRIITLTRKYSVLHKIKIGYIKDLKTLTNIGTVFMTVIKTSKTKELFLTIPRKMYVATLVGKNSCE